MREIKFRAWDSIRKKMVAVRQIVIPDGGNELGVQEISVSGLKFGTNPSNWLIAPPLMQYTGRKDPNGEEIYEGDIQNFGLWSDTGKPCLHKVYWNNETASFMTWDLRQNEGESGGLDASGEVVGNVHENPELLKEAQ